MQLTLEAYNINSGRSYASFGKDYFEIEFIEASSSKKSISLMRFFILRSSS